MTIKKSPPFNPRPMVGWFDPSELAKTGVQAVISSIFGSYADKRETLGMFSKFSVKDYCKEEEVWVDYMADTGDGFNSTYTMAHMLGKDSIVLPSGKELPRAKVLILGGDQVYPTATREEYENRLRGPFKAAFPNGQNKPTADLFVIPGNHDWYDGLNNFSKIFLQDRTVGNWQTQQHRSYFAIKIRPHTWIWGIDIQLESDIDYTQINYFKEVGETYASEGDDVILCTAEPSWVYHATNKHDTTYHNLKHFEERFITKSKKKLNLILSLSGDLHHYSRYSAANKEKETTYHKITAGGGGAFMHPTHQLPDKLTNLRDGNFDFQQSFPPRSASRNMIWGNLFFPFYNRKFGLFLAAFYLLFAWFLNISSLTANDNVYLVTKLGDPNLTSSIGNIFQLFFHTFIISPACIILVTLLVVGFTLFCDISTARSPLVRLFGTLHGMAHVALMCGLIWFFAVINHHLIGSNQGKLSTILFMAEIFGIGGGLAGFLTGVYLILSNLLFKIHSTEAYSSMKIEGYKNFLRLHFTRESLTIYPIGLKETVKWKWNSSTANFESESQPKPQLIEDPIIIKLSKPLTK